MTFPNAVIFDLDGTLIDSAPDLHIALNRLLDSDGRRELSLPEVIGMIGDGVPKLVERGYRATGSVPDARELVRCIERFGKDYEINATVKTRLFPAAVTVLQALTQANVKIGLCTNKPLLATREILRIFEIGDYFQSVVGGDSLPGIRKPDTRHLLAVLEALHVSPGQAVMVGDSANDIAVAKNTGVRAVAVSFGYCHGPVTELEADAIVDHFADLTDVLAGLAE